MELTAAERSPRQAGEQHPDGLDVVIVAYRSQHLLRSCLTSLREHPPSRPLTVSVVDNASGDWSSEVVLEEFPEFDLVRNELNIGFAAASNQGIRREGHRYVLLLNPDTSVPSGALDHLLALMDSRPEIGICGPRLVRDDGEFDHAAKRSFPTILGALGHFTGVGRREGAPAALAQYRAPAVHGGPVDAVNGAFMLIRRDGLDEVGLLDEGFWMYMEDLDLSYRFREAGWLTWYEPSVTVHHVKGGSSGPFRGPRLNHQFHRGMGRFYRKHYAPRRPWPLNVAVYAGIWAKLVISVAHNLARTLRFGHPAEFADRGGAPPTLSPAEPGSAARQAAAPGRAGPTVPPAP